MRPVTPPRSPQERGFSFSITAPVESKLNLKTGVSLFLDSTLPWAKLERSWEGDPGTLASTWVR
jgi:hypothetical protein